MPRGILYEHERKKRVAEAVEILANDNKKRQSNATKKPILQRNKERKGCAITMKRCEVFKLTLLVAFIWQQAILVFLEHQF